MAQTASQRARQRRKLERNKALVREARSRPCVDCGIDWLPPEVMHLDHSKGDKEIKLSGNCVAAFSADRIRAELEKCETRCPNCHGIRHFEDQIARAA